MDDNKEYPGEGGKVFWNRMNAYLSQNAMKHYFD